MDANEPRNKFDLIRLLAAFVAKFSRLSGADLRRWRPQLLGLAALAVISITAIAVSHSTLLDARGPLGLKQFFGEDSGLLVQPYQTPELVVHRGKLQISSDSSPTGLGLVVEASQEGPRKLEVEGRQMGAQVVTGRLTVDSQPSTYFSMPNGPLSIMVASGTRVELLIYADLPYAYQIDKTTLTVCPQCVTDAEAAQQSNGLAVAEQFFGESSGLVVQPYQKPRLKLHQGTLQIRGGTSSAGLELVFEPSPEGARKFELVGRQLGPQSVNGRLTIDGGTPAYFQMPDGLYSLNLAAGARVELLIYADQPFAYQIDKASLTGCPQCATEAQMVSRIKREIPALVLPPGAQSSTEGLAAAEQLMHWVSPKLVIENEQTLHARIGSTPLEQILSESFEGKQNGVSCGGFAVFMARLLNRFGYEAFVMDFGSQDMLTHVTTVVAIGPPGAKRFYVFDPTFNARLVKTRDGTPVHLAQALSLPPKEVRLYSSEGAMRDLLVPENLSVAGAEKAGGQCEVLAGRQLCRNVDQVGFMLEPLRGKFKQQGIGEPDFWLWLLKKGVFSITGAEPATRDALVKVLTTNGIAFMGSI